MANSNDPVVILGATANTLVQQYDSKIITLQQLKDSVNTQILPTFTTFNQNNFDDSNDEAKHDLDVAIRILNSPVEE